MGDHLVDGEFQSDKYPTTPRGKVPLSVKDPMAQDLLWIYAMRRIKVDREFSADLETALRNAGFADCDDTLIRNVIQDVCELPDRTSPFDNPEMLQVSTTELAQILERRLWGRE